MKVVAKKNFGQKLVDLFKRNLIMETGNCPVAIYFDTLNEKKHLLVSLIELIDNNNDVLYIMQNSENAERIDKIVSELKKTLESNVSFMKKTLEEYRGKNEAS